MQPKKENKFDKYFLVFFMLAVIYLAMVLSLAAGAGRTLETWYQHLDTVILPEFRKSGYGFAHPLWMKPYLNTYTPRFLFFGVLFGLIASLMYLAQRRNYIAGREYGTSRYMNPRQLTKILAEPDAAENIYEEQLPGKRKPDTLNRRNRQLSQNLQMSIDTRHTDLNNNIFIVGGPGSGKSFRFAIPLLMSLSSSFVVTDCKSELRKKTGTFLEKHGYIVKSFNLINKNGMKKSLKFNPFRYLRTETDVVKLTTSIIANTKVEDAMGSDPFWEKAERLLMQALMHYILEVEPKEKQNFRRYMELLSMAEFEFDPDTGGKKESELDLLFRNLEDKESLRIAREKRQRKENIRGMSLAVINYNKCMKAAPDTVRSIIICQNARLANLQTEEILNLLSEDDLDLAEIGMGHNYDGKTKTVLFLEVPDNDDSYNFVIGMLYTMLFQELYYQADHICEGGELPIHVTNLWDEFANVALPENVCDLMSTMRGRNISAIPIIQNMAQIKGMYKDTWETIPGNCDTLIYLGGNEQSTHEYVSKMLGKGTFDKRTTGETLGIHGSGSRNYDVIGRELMLPEEVRKMKRNQCLVLIAGYDPVIDFKIRTQRLWQFYYYANPIYEFDRKNCKYIRTKGLAFAGSGQLAALQAREQHEEAKKIFEISAEALMNISSEQIDAYAASGWLKRLEEDVLADNAERVREEEEKSRENITDEELNQMSSDDIKSVLKLRQGGYTDGQIRIMLWLRQRDATMTQEELTGIFTTDMDTARMKQLAESMIHNNNQELEESKNEKN